MLHDPPKRAPRLATTLDDVSDVLSYDPLEFEGKNSTGDNWYVSRTPRMQGAIRVGEAADTLRKKLLGSTGDTKLFLSGHVGSGKSTEIVRLAVDERITRAFSPIVLRVESGFWADLDIAQLLFLMAAALFDQAEKAKLLSDENAWEKPLRELRQRLEQKWGKQQSGGVEVNAFFVKVKYELSLEQGRKKEFHEIGDKELSLLTDLVAGLDLDIRKCLALRGDSRTPLLLIDDLDKVREKTPQENVFRENLSALQELPLRVLYTVPTGVAFDRCPPGIRESLVHLYPVQILQKERTFDSFAPEESINEVGLPFLHAVLRSRLSEGLIEADAIRIAGVYSGGVLRTFFRLIRAAADLAVDNDRTVIDPAVMWVAIKETRLTETMSLRGEHYRALAEVHRTKKMEGLVDGSYLDNGYVIECFNDKVWYEANPLLWKLLRPEEL